jgi:hypothetical protein
MLKDLALPCSAFSAHEKQPRFLKPGLGIGKPPDEVFFLDREKTIW